MDNITRSVLLACELVVIPVQPSPYDIWAAQDTVKLVREVSVYKETLKAAFTINRKIVNTAIGRDVREALAQYELQVLEAAVSQRVAFAESAGQGMTVLETAPDSQAASEIRAHPRHFKTRGDSSPMKKVSITSKPDRSRKATTEAVAEAWVAERQAGGDEPTKRLTIDVPFSLHRRMKAECALDGVNMAGVVRELLDERFGAAAQD